MDPRPAAARSQGNGNAGALQVLKQFLNAGKHLDSVHFGPKHHILHVTMGQNLVVRKFAQKKPENLLSLSALANESEISVAYRFPQREKESFPGSYVGGVAIHDDSIHIEDDVRQHNR